MCEVAPPADVPAGRAAATAKTGCGQTAAFLVRKLNTLLCGLWSWRACLCSSSCAGQVSAMSNEKPVRGRRSLTSTVCGRRREPGLSAPDQIRHQGGVPVGCPLPISKQEAKRRTRKSVVCVSVGRPAERIHLFICLCKSMRSRIPRLV